MLFNQFRVSFTLFLPMHASVISHYIYDPIIAPFCKHAMHSNPAGNMFAILIAYGR